MGSAQLKEVDTNVIVGSFIHDHYSHYHLLIISIIQHYKIMEQTT